MAIANGKRQQQIKSTTPVPRGQGKRTAAAWVIGWAAIHPDNGRGAGGASGHDTVARVLGGGEVLAGVVVVAAKGG